MKLFDLFEWKMFCKRQRFELEKNGYILEKSGFSKFNKNV